MRNYIKPDVLRFHDTVEIRRFLNPFWFAYAVPLGEGEKFYSIELYHYSGGMEFRSCRLFQEDLLALKLVGKVMETA